jgi:hypothetical protein
LASSLPPQQVLDNTVSEFGISAPVVMSIVKSSSEAMVDSTVNYTVTFNESVTGVDTTDFSLATSSGISGAAIASVTGSGSSYLVTVSTGSGAGTLGLNLVDNDSIVDQANNPLGGPGIGNGSFTGPTYSVSPAQAAVTLSSVTNPINSSNDTATTASGTGAVGATVSVVASDGTNSTVAQTVTVASDGSWMISGINVGSLTDGTITYTATAMDSTGNTAQATKTATKDTVAPSVAISAVTDPINEAHVSSTSANGTGEAGATISLLATDGTITTSPVTTSVASNGTWSFSTINLSSLTDGTITFTVTATDAAGNTAQATKTATKDTVAPAVSVTSVTDPITIANRHITQATGTGEVGATISLVASDGTNSTTAQTTTVALNGTWTIAGIDVSGLADGIITYNVTATDPAGNTATTSKTGTKSTVVISSVISPINHANAGSVTASGTGEAGATIELVASDGTHDTTVQTTTVGSDGTWTIPGIDVTTLADGTVTFTVTATDTSGNMTATFKTTTKDTVAPAVAVTSVTNPIDISNVGSTTASGTGEANANISVVVSDGTHSTTAQTTTVASNGAWSIEGINVSALADGTLTFTATATDTVGNTATSSMTATKDTVAPIADAITLGEASPTSATSVTFTATFSEIVTGVADGDFTVVMGSGLSGASITSVTGSGTTYTVTASTGGGTGTLGLNLVSAGTIQDTAGNGLAGELPLVGSIYTVTAGAATVTPSLANLLVDQAVASEDSWIN